MTILSPVLQYAHQLLQQQLRVGDVAVDGTAGNGHDTLHLAQCVGATGKVWAFDIQPIALATTQQRLQMAGQASQVALVLSGHQHIADYVPHGIAAAVFNFGYLPTGDKLVTTQAETSLQALQAALSLLKIGGLLVAVVYRGHPAGEREAAHIEAWASALIQQHYRVLCYQFLNQRNQPPFLLAIEKLSDD